VATCWRLRKIDRDHGAAFGDMLAVAAPFNEDLTRRLESFSSAFGHNSRCADFLVFQGERADSSAERKSLFERGLAVCPGHRNSAMLLSHEYLIEVDKLLLKTATMPAAFARVSSRRVETNVREAWDLCQTCERVYPYNEHLDEYRERVRAEADRFGLDLETTEAP